MPPRKRKAPSDGGRDHQKMSRTTRATRSMTTDASRQAVLNTTELLEQIMLQLPARSIFGVQRVCKQFRDLIGTSIPIQQRLFLKSSIKPHLWKIQRESGENIDASLQIEGKDQQLRVVVCAEEELRATRANPSPKYREPKAMPVKLNPLLLSRSGSHARDSVLEKLRLGPTLRLTIDLGEAPLMQPQSWRQMLLTNPPVDEASVFVHWSVKGVRSSRRDSAVEYRFKDGNGLTLGAVIDSALNRLSREYDGYGEVLTSTAAERIQLKERQTGNPGRISTKNVSSVDLFGVIIPTEEEWTAVTGGR